MKANLIKMWNDQTYYGFFEQPVNFNKFLYDIHLYNSVDWGIYLPLIRIFF